MFFRYTTFSVLAVAIAVALLQSPARANDYSGTNLAGASDRATYDGQLLVFLVEPVSRWTDNWDDPFHFGFLDYSADSIISVSQDDTIDITADWYAPDHGFSSIDEHNIMAIAAVFNAEGHERYTKPSAGTYPFTAHFVDAAAGATPGNPGSNQTGSGFTHTVLVEDATAWWCPNCPYVSLHLDAIYHSGDYPFYFVSLVEDRGSVLGDSLGTTRTHEVYNVWALPTIYADGGFRVDNGGLMTEAEIREHIEASGAREVPELELELSLEWVADNTVRTHVRIYHSPEIPPFTINLLPNPVLPFELDVIAFPSEPLLSEPNVIITTPIDVDTLGMTLLGDRNATTYSLDYQITQSGAHSISICGTDLNEVYSCSDELFSAAPIHADDGVTLVSYSGLYELTIPPFSFARDALLLCWEEYPTDDNMAGLNMPLDITSVLLIKTESASRNLKSDAALTFDLNKLDLTRDEQRSVVLLYLGEEEVRQLDARLDFTDGELTAEISELGTYLIGLSSAVDDGIDGDVTTPSAYRLDQNWPNPFNTGTTISFSLSDPTLVRLDIYNILGQKVVTLVDKYVSGGSHDISWDGTNSDGDYCSSGVYFYRLKTDAFSEIKRMLLLK
jgi:hypothetical protein